MVLGEAKRSAGNVALTEADPAGCESGFTMVLDVGATRGIDATNVGEVIDAADLTDVIDAELTRAPLDGARG